MKKYALLFVVALLVMFGLITQVHAKENVLEINIYEYSNYDSMSELDKYVFDELFMLNYVTSECTYDNDIDTCIAYRNGKPFEEYKERYISETDTYETISDVMNFEAFTRDDDIEYTFTEEQKEYISSNDNNPFKGYDKIIVHFSNKPGTVMIKEIDLVERVGMAVINSPAKINGLNIDVDVKFKDINDKVVYKALVKNNSDKDYYLTKGNINSTDEYIKYQFEYDGNDDTIKAGEMKYVTITMTYDKEVPVAALASGKYESSSKIDFILSTEREEITANPKTVDNIIKTVIILAVSVAVLILMIKVQIIRKAMMVILALIMVMPFVVKAIEKLNITINTSVSVTKNPSFTFYNNKSKDPTYYEYEEGMTWEEWLQSDYNTDNITVYVSGNEEYFECITSMSGVGPILPDTNSKAAAPQSEALSPCSGYTYNDVNITDPIQPVTEQSYGGYIGAPIFCHNCAVVAGPGAME